MKRARRFGWFAVEVLDWDGLGWMMSAPVTLLVCQSEMQICQGKGKPRDDGLFLGYFNVFSWRVVGVGSSQP